MQQLSSGFLLLHGDFARVTNSAWMPKRWLQRTGHQVQTLNVTTFSNEQHK